MRGGEQEIGEGGGRRQERVENEGDEGKERKKPQKDSKGFERTLSEFYEGLKKEKRKVKVKK